MVLTHIRTHSVRLLTIVVLLVAVAGCTVAAQQPVTSTPTVGPSVTPAPTAISPAAQANTQPAASPPPAAIAQATSTAVPTVLPPATPAPSASPTPIPSNTAVATAAPTATAQRFSGTGAYQHVTALGATIGSRPAGSAALEQAAAYIKSQFEALGYSAQFQAFSSTGFQERSSSLVVNQPQRVEVSARALALSGSGNAEGQMIYAGLGLPADFPAAGAQGKIVLVDRGGNVPFQSKVDAAVSRGAVGVVIANDRSGELRGSLSQAAKVPVVAILQADGEKLREYIRQGQTTVTLTIDASISVRQGQNVVASATSGTGRKKVVIGAHYDSVTAGPGANDNASGVATILQLAREMRDQSLPFDLVFVAFGDEEIGLVGSKNYVQSLSAQERTQIVAMLNFDMVGVGDKMAFGGDKDLVSQALQIAQRAGYPAQQLTLPGNQSSDHASFQDAGIPALFFYRQEDPNYHTAGDTAQWVTPANLETAGTVAIRLLEALAKRG